MVPSMAHVVSVPPSFCADSSSAIPSPPPIGDDRNVVILDDAPEPRIAAPRIPPIASLSSVVVRLAIPSRIPLIAEVTVMALPAEGISCI